MTAEFDWVPAFGDRVPHEYSPVVAAADDPAVGQHRHRGDSAAMTAEFQGEREAGWADWDRIPDKHPSVFSATFPKQLILHSL